MTRRTEREPVDFPYRLRGKITPTLQRGLNGDVNGMLNELRSKPADSADYADEWADALVVMAAWRGALPEGVDTAHAVPDGFPDLRHASNGGGCLGGRVGSIGGRRR